VRETETNNVRRMRHRNGDLTWILLFFSNWTKRSLEEFRFVVFLCSCCCFYCCYCSVELYLYYVSVIGPKLKPKNQPKWCRNTDIIKLFFFYGQTV